MESFVQSTIKRMMLLNGENASFTLNYAMLYKLRAEKPKIYAKYQQIQRKDKEKMDDFDVLYILYTAYCCANIKEENLKSYVEFLEIIPHDGVKIKDILESLLAPSKKKTVSLSNSENQQKK